MITISNMAKWKLCRQVFGDEEFIFEEGEEISVGRGYDNKITLSSIVISRNHCVINVQKENILITDLKSSNGTYVGSEKIPVKTAFTARHNDLIGFGWTTLLDSMPLVADKDKHVFKLVKEKSASTASRIQYHSDSDDYLENQIAALNGTVCKKNELESKTLKRKSYDAVDSVSTKVRKNDTLSDTDVNNGVFKVKQERDLKVQNTNIINLLSDSDSETTTKETKKLPPRKNIKIDPILEEPIKEDVIKIENEMPEYEVFDVKQEYLGFDDNEAILVDSDTESESEQWLMRLSQSSPGKAFMRCSQIIPQQENTSYSQIEEPIIKQDNNHDEEFDDDIISIPPLPQSREYDNIISPNKAKDDVSLINRKHPEETINHETDEEDIMSDIISFITPMTSTRKVEDSEDQGEDGVDGVAMIPPKPVVENQNETAKKAQMIEPLMQLPKRRAHHGNIAEAKPKSSSSKSITSTIKSSSSTSKRGKSLKYSSSKTHISETQKEERKKRLKEIATKDKQSGLNSSKTDNQSNKSKVNVKVTSSNRGAFLAEAQTAQAVVRPMAKKESPEKPHKQKDRKTERSKKSSKEPETRSEDIENSKNQKEKDSKESEPSKTKIPKKPSDVRIPLKSRKPLSETEKPISKVVPMPTAKPKKSVRFSNAPPQVREFDIEPGNKMNKTSLIKTTLADTRQMPAFSLEKITLMKILRWNPQWLDEQKNNNEPPPILGHSNPPLGMFQAFENHQQYVGQVGDLLLMEIWECVTQGHMRVRQQDSELRMKILSLPPPPPQDRYDLFIITVEIAVPRQDVKKIPRMGEIMIVYFGPDNAKTSRFLYVTNVQQPNDRRPCYTVTLQATFTEKMRSLNQGDFMTGRSLAYIHNELTLFEAMDYLAGSPLSEAILKPEPHHFPEVEHHAECNMNSQWTKGLNDSQKAAVSTSVSAALGDRPRIQMVQGPPGTGKSAVICAMVMAYFYDAQELKIQNRGKVLICATSNAAVDELVIRLLNIRQTLPKKQRFRMVRVGRAEAMHARARDVSSQQLAQRHARPRAEEPQPAVREEISRLTAKINMWKTMAGEGADQPRIAYCEQRMKHYLEKRTRVEAAAGVGGNEELRPDEVARAERHVIDCSDIVLTTLASAMNQKMRGLKRRIALCIVDEAGQAIEPETLIPLTLDVTRLTLIGDPQQLPGFICSQRAKRHGLGDSLFSRLAGSAEAWARGPLVLLSTQYRMQPAIADYPVRAFYAGRVAAAPAPRPALPLPPYTILAIASGDRGQGLAGGNELEAWGVTRLVAALRDVARRMGLSLAVITPYHAHKELIKRNLRTIQPDQSDPGVEVNTVDSFQGQERDIVVVSLARSQGVGFLTDAGRLNVMLTRARHALVVALNPNAVMRNDQWRTLVEDAQRRRLLRQLPNRMCQPIVRGQYVEDVLQYIK